MSFSHKHAVGRLVVVAVIGSAGFSGLTAAGSDEPRQPINAFCPVMTEEKVDPAFTTIYQGKIIGFCCDKCLAKFEANPSRYAARLVELRESPSDADDATHDQRENTKAPSTGLQSHGTRDVHAEKAEAPANGEHGQAQDHVEHEERAATDRDHDHEHQHTHDRSEGFWARLIGWLGKFHPAMVNFPIAMILGTALAELLLLATRRSFFVYAGRFCLWTGCVGAVVAALLGWFFGGFHLVDDSWILTTHRWLGTTTAAWSVLLLIVGEQTYRRGVGTRRCYRALLWVGATLVGVSGFFGGSLVYGLTHYAWP